MQEHLLWDRCFPSISLIERTKKSKQGDELGPEIKASEPLQEAGWESADRDHGHELRACHFPEGTLNEALNPPGSPALDRRPRNTKPFSELLRASIGYTGTQGAGQHDDSGEVDAAAQKPHARRAVALLAPRAAKAEVEMWSLSEPDQTVTTRFALIAVLVQSATTAPTAACLGLGGQAFVDAQKKLIEFIVQQSIVTHAQLPTVT